VALALHQQRRRGIGLFRLAAAHAHADVGAAQCVEELQPAVVDAQALELRACPASAVTQEIPVARLALARGGFQQHVRSGQAHFRQLHAAAQQGPHPHVDLDAVGGGHVRLLRPAGIGEGDGIGTDGAGAAEFDIQVADVQCTTGACLHRALDRTLEPVPVPQRDHHQDHCQQEDQNRERAPAARARSAEAPAGRARCGRGGGSIHAAMVAPSSWTGREASMCAVCTTRAVTAPAW